MKQFLRVFAVVGLALTAGAWLTAGPAVAMPTQVFHTQIDETFTDVPDFCGLTVDIQVKGTDTFTVHFDQSGAVSQIQAQGHIVQTITNQATGAVVYVETAGRFNAPAPVINPDGTISLEMTYTGMPERIYTTHSAVLVNDVGFIEFHATFSPDGNLIEERVIQHGPHPEADSDFTLFCQAIVSAIG